MISFTYVAKDDNSRQNGLVNVSFAENVYPRNLKSHSDFCYCSIHALTLNVYVHSFKYS